MSDVLAAQEVQIMSVEIAKLRLERGDILVVRLSERLNTKEVSKHVHDTLEAIMRQAGVRAPILIGPTDFDMTVLKAPDATDAKA